MEKIKPTILIGLLSMILLVSLASAALEITENDIDLGVDYSQFADEDQKNITATTTTFTVRNTDTANPVTATVTVEGLPANYQLVESKTITLTPNSSQSLTLQLRVPHKEGGGSTTIGTVRAQSGALVDSANLVQKTKSMLELAEVEVEYTDEDDNDKKDAFDEADTEFNLEDDILIGTEISFRFQIENLFDTDYDSDKSLLKQISLTIKANDNDVFTDDIEQEYDFDDLDADESDELTITTDINPEIDPGEYRLDLTLEGKDDQGARYKIEKELRFEIVRKRQDIRITSFTISPTPVTTCDPEFMVQVELVNYGSRDQRYAAFSAYNQALGINLQEKNLVLDSYSERNDDDEWTKTYTIPLKKELTAGTYPLTVIAYVDLDIETDEEEFDVVVESCPSTTIPTVPSANNTPPTNTPPPSTSPATTPGPSQPLATTTTPPSTAPTSPSTKVISTTERAYQVEDFLVGGVIAIIILIVALIALFMVILLRK